MKYESNGKSIRIAHLEITADLMLSDEVTVTFLR